MLDALDEPLRIPKLDLALWIFLVGICGGAIFGTVKASKAFVQTYDSNSKRIVAAEKSLAKAAKAERGGVRANAALIKDIDSRRTSLNKELLQVWQTLYDRQAMFQVWPKEAGIVQPDAAKEAPADEPAAKDEPAGKKAKKKKPKPKAQANTKAELEQDIPAAVCKSYNDNVVRSEFERIFDRLQVRRPKAGADSGRTNGLFKDRPADFDGLVAWDSNQREAIISRHCLTKGAPSSARVRLVQEDLWIFESLIDAIASLNRNAKDALNAPVKEVNALNVAQSAMAACAQQARGISLPEESQTPSAASPASDLGLPVDASDNAFLNGRYLDEKGQPLKSDAAQPFAEFKQVFVYVKVVVDQRRVPRLLTALANAAMPVEVRHFAVQLLPDRSAGEVRVTEGGNAASASPQPASPAIGGLSSAETTAWDATVEIGGIVYLYNPPNIKRLGTGAAKLPVERTFRIPAVAAVPVK